MNNIPTIMFHTVGLREHNWVFPWISDTEEYFESVIHYLSKKGYKSHFFSSTIYEENVSGKNIVLTFDDGYLDNYHVIFPLLEKYGMKGTIFVNSDFAVKENVIRRKSDEIAGFLSYAEMRELEKSGVMEIQSHSKTHTWYFSSDKIIDYWRPGIATERNGAVWMLWNKFPEFKPYYLTLAADYEKKIPYGTPIYESTKALVCKKYNSNPNLDDFMVNYAKNKGGEDFFCYSKWKEDMDKAVEQYKKEHDQISSLGVYETEEERRTRIFEELKIPKIILEQELNKKISCLCWPGGGVDEMVLNIAKEVGYTRFTRPSAWRNNLDPAFSEMIERFGGGAKLKYKRKNSIPWEIGYRLNKFLDKKIVAQYYGANLWLRCKLQG